MLESRVLRDLLLLTKDGEWGKGEFAENLCEMLVIRGTDFEAARYGDLKNIPMRFIPKHIAERKQLHPEDILIETAGGTKDQPTGRTVFLKESLFRRSSKPITCASFSRFLRIDKSQAVPEYVFWYLQFLYMSGQMEQHQVQHTGVARFQYTKFAESTKIPLPQIEEQRTIARILGTLDDKIELNRSMNETLEAMARAIFKSWFVDFDPVRANAECREPAGMDADTAALFPDSFEETELGIVPKGWKIVPLPKIIAVNPPRSLHKGAIAPYLDMASMPKRGHVPEAVTSRPFGSGRRFINGDILVARITPCLENGKTAYVDLLKNGEVGWGSTEYIVLRPKPPLPTEFAYCLARSREFRGFAIQSMTGTSGRQRVPAQALSHYFLVSPPPTISEYFGNLVNPLFARARKAMTESHNLANLRDALLPKLISGEMWDKDTETLLSEHSPSNTSNI
jgi:type I restriction enzyme, S subunit